MHDALSSADEDGWTSNSNEPADLVAFELVVFERSGMTIEVTVRGMTSACDLEAFTFETGAKATVSVMGTHVDQDTRPFEVSAIVEVEDGRQVIVRGLGMVEAVVASSVPEGLPVVCGIDPLQAGIEGDFLHRRGQRYVLMSASPARSARLRHPAAMVA